MYYAMIAIGYLAGILTPGVIRRIRGEAKKDVSIVEAEIKAAEADVKAEAKKL